MPVRFAKIPVLLLAVCVLAPVAHAQAPGQEETAFSSVTTEKAKVLAVESAETKVIPGTETEATYQRLRVEILTGPEKGIVVTAENDYLALSPGDVFYVMHTVNELEGIDAYTVLEPDRIPILGWLLLAFVAVVIAVGGWTGLRGLIALAGSILAVFYVLLPGIASGYDPFLVSLGVAAIIIFLNAYLTHGANRATSAAVIGLVATIAVTAVIAHFAIAAARLSGFADEGSVALHFATRGSIDFVGLLLGAILIGALGILYDAAIGQAVAIDELVRAAPDMPRARLFARGMRIGREHIGALVNTLAIAYVGVALPLLLLFQTFGQESFLEVINREAFATEIVRALVGSIGIVLTVPVTTAVAVFLLTRPNFLTRRSQTSGTMNDNEERHHHHGR